MKLSNRTTAEKLRKRRGLLAVIAASSLVALPGCGIPQLRCAQSGPVLPHQYNFAMGWNAAAAEHPAISPGDSGTELKKPSPDAEQEKTDSKQAASASDKSASNSKGFFKLVSFVKPANSIAVDDAAQNNTDPADGPVAMSTNGLTIDSYASANSFVPAIPPDLGVNSFENSAQLSWHEFFEDPQLASLIDQALVGNQELKILGEEIQIACNEVYARSGEYRPFVTLGAGLGIEKSGRHTRAGAVEESLEVADGRGFPDPLPNFLVGTNVSWELDIWKKLRNSQRSAAMRYLATAEGRNYVVTRLVAEIAQSYYELLALDNRLLTLDKTIAIQEASLRTAEAMKDAARGTELAVQRFEAEVRKNQSEKLIIQQEIIQTENRINFLVGRYPQPVDRASVEYIDLNLHSVSAGVPSQLLQNRPDIREAERVLQAAGLDIRVARARFYPSLNLTAGLGYNAFAAGYLFRTPESLIYGIGGDLIAPLINKRAIQAAYRTANAKQLQAVYEYQRTVLTAYTEVINQMTKVANYGQSIEVKKQQLTALEGSVDSATKLFQNARGEYLDVLLAQRDMMEARMVLIETKQQQLAAVVNTYQALGGSGAVVIVR